MSTSVYVNIVGCFIVALLFGAMMIFQSSSYYIWIGLGGIGAVLFLGIVNHLQIKLTEQEKEYAGIYLASLGKY